MPTPRRYANQAQRQAAYRQRQAEAQQQQRVGRSVPAPPAISSMPNWRRWEALTGHALQSLRVVQKEMEAYHNARSSEWQDSERGESFLERLQTLEDIVGALEDAT